MCGSRSLAVGYPQRGLLRLLPAGECVFACLAFAKSPGLDRFRVKECLLGGFPAKRLNSRDGDGMLLEAGFSGVAGQGYARPGGR